MKKYIFPLFLSLSLFSQESEDKVENESVEEVVVIGTKASIISAIEKQRKSNLIVSVVAVSYTHLTLPTPPYV